MTADQGNKNSADISDGFISGNVGGVGWHISVTNVADVPSNVHHAVGHISHESISHCRQTHCTRFSRRGFHDLKTLISSSRLRPFPLQQKTCMPC